VWLGFGLGLAFQHLAASYATYARVVESGTLVAPLVISNVLGMGGPLALTLAPFLLLIFPTGRLPSRRWRPLAWAASGTVILLILFFRSPDKVGGIVTITAAAAVFVIFSAFALSAFSLLVRYREASGVERQQLKWFAFSAVLVACFLVGQQLTWLVGHLIAYVLGGELLSLNRSLERVMNLRKSRIEMRISRSAWSPRDLCFPYF
jgi:hypothetical protein